MSLNKTNIPIEVNRKTKLDLSCEHITSMSFMQPQPVWYRHCIKGEHLNFDALATLMPAPIEVPLYSRMRLNLRGFFVPYRLVFPNWDSFYNDTIASNLDNSSLVSSCPSLANSSIVSMFRNAGYAGSVPTVWTGTTKLIEKIADVSDSSYNPDEQPFDFIFANQYWRYTTTGKRFLKILNSLGYVFSWASKSDNLNFNALGILAWAKIYIDWYSNSQYLNSADVLRLERLLKYNDPTGYLVVGDSQLYNILNLISYVVYDSDGYFVDAWDNPNSPVNGQYTPFTFVDPTSNSGTFVATNSLGTPEMSLGSADPNGIGTEYLHHALKKLSDFQKRHALAGARSIDRVLAQYGFASDALKSQRSVYVGHQSIDVDTGAIYATADSVGSNGASSVGDYAGRGFGQGKKSWDFKVDEEGVFIVIASIVPDVHYVLGYDRNNRHRDKFDFFVPALDSLSVQGIEKGELFVSNNPEFVDGDTDRYATLFGFTGRYAEYKRPLSFLTGDFRVPSAYQGSSAWHLFRLFDDSSFGGNIANMVHSLGFTRGIDSDQYNRVFQYTGSDLDKFYVHLHFNVGSIAPCLPIFETYEFDDSHSSKRVMIDTNGSKVN